MSPASASPRRVGLIPTTTAPDRAAAASQKRYSGTLPSSTPTWGGSSPPSDPSRAARSAPAATTSRQDQLRSPATSPGRSSALRARRRSATLGVSSLSVPSTGMAVTIPVVVAAGRAYHRGRSPSGVHGRDTRRNTMGQRKAAVDIKRLGGRGLGGGRRLRGHRRLDAGHGVLPRRGGEPDHRDDGHDHHRDAGLEGRRRPDLHLLHRRRGAGGEARGRSSPSTPTTTSATSPGWSRPSPTRWPT